MSQSAESVTLSQQNNYRFEIRFGQAIPVLIADEPAPLGSGTGPSPVQLLAAAVGNCLSASLLFAFRKFKQSAEPIACTVNAEVGRNSEARLRVLKLDVTLRLGVPAVGVEHLERVLATFESYCTVTQSVSAAIPVSLQVFDSIGAKLK